MSGIGATTLLDFYNMLLEADRAGVLVLDKLVRKVEDDQLKTLLKKFLRDEGVNCRILMTLIHDLGAKPTTKTGAFVNKVHALNNLEDKVQLLLRGQEWVARKIQEFHHHLPAGSSYFFLTAIKLQHEENVDTLKKYFT
ncbi:MAG: DUF6306 domain-containing protein [Desulfobacterales bacterium]